MKKRKEWQVIAPLLPPPHGNQEIELRAIVNGIFYFNATGCQWRALPYEYPVWSSVYYHFAKKEKGHQSHQRFRSKSKGEKDARYNFTGFCGGSQAENRTIDRRIESDV